MPEMVHKRDPILAACFLLLPFLIVGIILILHRDGIAPVIELDAGSRTVLRTCLGAFGLINLAMPYLRQKQFRIALERSGLTPVDLELRFFMLGLSYCATPAIFGLVLFLVGDPMLHAIYGVIASFIGEAAWSYHVLRARSGAGNR